MLESMLGSLDYFDNNGNNKLEQALRIAMKELDKDLIAAGYAAPKNVLESLSNLHEALEDVIDFEAENDLSDKEIFETELEDLDEDEEEGDEHSDESEEEDDSEDPD